jgi:hypothetical protein
MRRAALALPGAAWVRCSADATDPQNALNAAAPSRLEACCVPLTSPLRENVQ